MEVRPLTGRPGLLQGGWASHREARPLTGKPGISQGGRTSLREPGLSQCLMYQLLINLKIFNFATKQQKILPCWFHKSFLPRIADPAFQRIQIACFQSIESIQSR